jgi:hypothetical protein
VEKAEKKAESFSSASSTLLILPKRPHAISAETPVHKCGAVTRALKILKAFAEEGDDGEQLESLEKLLVGSTSAGEISNGEV